MQDERFSNSVPPKTSTLGLPTANLVESENEPECEQIALSESLPSNQDWFYSYCNQVIVATLARLSLQPADRDDCGQQVWVELLATHASGFRGGRLSAWLATLARNKAIDVVRRARRQPSGLGIVESEQPIASSDGPSHSEDASLLVRMALAELESQVEQRSFTSFVLRSIDGLSFAQIASELQMTPEQIRARHHRTKQKFRRIVENFAALREDGRPRVRMAVNVSRKASNSHGDGGC